MKRLFTLLIFAGIIATYAQNLYSKAFGNPKAEPILFLHGGPCYNSANFEATTAETLANEGYYVIVYDRRGEGRSAQLKAEFTFNETFADINKIYKTYHLKKANIIGHSFGGMVATLFAKQQPKKVKSIILAGAPISLQESFTYIIQKSRGIYESKMDSMSLFYLNMLEKMDTNSMQYASYCFMNAMKNGFYSPKSPTADAQKIYATLGSSDLFKWTKEMTQQAPQGFSDNEKYTTLNLKNTVIELISSGTKVYGIYGQEDGLYSPEQILELGKIMGAKENLLYVENCSHNVFIDQQQKFIAAINSWCK
jgi:proline iminopeptidase